MKTGRTKNAIRNTVFGFIMKMVQILLPFMTRTVMIHTLGMQFVGLSSLFTSILSVLNMAELGIGSAMVFSMYEPVATGDDKKVSALLYLYKLYYRIIGLIVGGIGIALVPFLDVLIKDSAEGNVPAGISITVLYLMNLGATVLSYWLFAYRASVLQAHQRTDISSKVRIVMTVIQNVLQIMALYFVRNYYYFVMITLLIQIATNISTAYIAKKLYPQYAPVGKLDKEEVSIINHKIKDLFTSKVGSVVFSSVDNLVISAFLGLSMVGIYQNYYYVCNSIIGILQIVYVSITAGIGNSIILETQEKNFKDLNKLTFIIAWISGFCTCCMVALYQPFMKIWAGEKSMQPFGFVICISAFFFVWELYRLINVYKDAAGMWHEDRFRPLASAIANLAMNLILIQFWGLYGVILSTLLSVLFVGTPWLLHNIFTNLFDMKYCRRYVGKLIYYVVVTAVASAATYGVCYFVKMEGMLGLGIKTAICCVVPNIIFLLVFYRMEEFKQFIRLVDNITGKKLHLEEKVIR